MYNLLKRPEITLEKLQNVGIVNLENYSEEVKQQVLDMKEYQSLKDQLQIVHQENIELRKKLNELLTAMTNVTHKD